jgi:hypothetical protein
MYTPPAQSPTAEDWQKVAHALVFGTHDSQSVVGVQESLRSGNHMQHFAEMVIGLVL